ncbi:MAG: hypothetical protein M0C28_46615 [Candidatus Moduliflexus flocculans]|nr:hypothetical protein [Candidatus Moduliflexus flocculans]
MDSHNVWDSILARVETKINRHSFYTWFKPSSFLSEAGDQVRVRVPNPVFRDWLTKHYAGLINEALAELDRPMVHHRVRGGDAVGGAVAGDGGGRAAAPAGGSGGGRGVGPGCRAGRRPGLAGGTARCRRTPRPGSG